MPSRGHLGPNLDFQVNCNISFVLYYKIFRQDLCRYNGTTALVSFDVLHNVYKVIKRENEWHAEVDRRGFGIKQDFIPLFLFMYVQNLWQGQKAVLTIIEFEFFDIFYFKFQLVSTFFICSQFCVENWLFCCDLSCKWVSCRSGCKRFWKSALHT